MARRGIRSKSGEMLDKATVSLVIQKLNSEKPITKKDACAILHISYNTTRLNKIIEDFVDKEEYSRKRRKQVRTTPVSDQDAAFIISSYMEGDALSDISDRTFRSVNVIKTILQKYNIPLRSTEHTYANPVMLPDAAIKEEYKTDDLVYSARYSCPAVIVKELPSSPDHGRIYRIWVYGSYDQYAIQPYYELGDLTHIQKELGVKIEDFPGEEVKRLLYETMVKSRKKDK